MSHVLILYLDPRLDVEAYELAGELSHRKDIRAIEVRDLDDGDELVKMSTVKNAVRTGLENCYVIPAEPEFVTEPDTNPGISPAAHNAISEYARARAEERAAREAAERPAQIRARQDERRAELEEYDRAAARERDRRLFERRERECHGGCSRGGEGPSCGKPGCY